MKPNEHFLIEMTAVQAYERPRNRWKLKAKPDAGKVTALAKALNGNEIISALLVQRGITTFDEAKKFFRPSLADLHDPFLMQDMDKAVVRIETAIANNEKILVYGDY